MSGPAERNGGFVVEAGGELIGERNGTRRKCASASARISINHHQDRERGRICKDYHIKFDFGYGSTGFRTNK